jgi:ketosteroid isomerase-like protein
VKTVLASALALVLLACGASFAQNSISDEGGRVLGLENAWNHAIEAKDTKALDMLLASTFIAVEIDGSISSKSEFLASIKDPEYKPSQAVNEQLNVQVYGDAAIVVGVFRIKGIEKGKPYVHRERFTDTWIKHDHTWQCVASQSTLIPAK